MATEPAVVSPADYGSDAASSERIARARRRAALQKRKLALAIAAALALFFLLSWLARKSAPQAPAFFLEWPQFLEFGKGKAEANSIVLLRQSAPLFVSVTDAAHWDLTTDNRFVEKRIGSTRFTWMPSGLAPGQDTSIDVKCTPQPGGWRQFFAWQWPTYTIHLNGIAGLRVGEHLQRLTPVSGTRVLVASRVVADGPTIWDDRAISILEKVAQKHNMKVWKLRPAFEGKSVAVDGATYVRFNAEALPAKPAARQRLSTQNSVAANTARNSVTRNATAAKPKTAPATYADITQKAHNVARDLSIADERIGVKYVVRLDETPPSATYRLDFTGKKMRVGWIKKNARDKAAVVRW